MANERIKLDMTLEEMLYAMSGGNTGALNVCVQLLRNGAKIDPDAADGGFDTICYLDLLGIYEDRIWNLYKYVCGGHLDKMMALLRASQLGGLAGVNTQMLNHAIDNHDQKIDLDAVMETVKKRLPNFNP